MKTFEKLPTDVNASSKEATILQELIKLFSLLSIFHWQSFRLKYSSLKCIYQAQTETPSFCLLDIAKVAVIN